MLLKFILLYLSLIFASFVAAEEPHTVVTSHWNNYTNQDGSGFYFDILKLALGKDLKNRIVPWARAQEEFKQGKAIILLGESSGMDYCQYPRWIMDIDFFSTYSLKSKVGEISEVKSLLPFKLAWVRGYEVDKFAPELKNYIEVEDVQSGLQMVRNGRVDVLIDYAQDIQSYIEKNKLDSREHILTKAIIPAADIHVCFSKMPDGVKLQKLFDEKMDVFNKNGQLKRIYEKYNREKYFELIRKRATPISSD